MEQNPSKMSDFVTLTEAARLTGERRGTLEQRIRRGTLQAEKREGIWYVQSPTPAPTRPQEAIPGGSTPVGVQSQVVARMPITEANQALWDAVGEQTDLVERLQAELRLMQANHLRDIELLENRLSAVEDQNVQQEVTLRAWKPIIELAGRELGYYRPVQTREDRERALTVESQRARPNRLLGVLTGIVKG